MTKRSAVGPPPHDPNVQYADSALIPKWMLQERTRCLNPTARETTDLSTLTAETTKGSSIVYWMHRDVRTVDNWALLWASWMAKQQRVPLRVVYALPPPPSSASNINDDDDDEALPPTLEQMPMTDRHGSFLLGGLEHVHAELHKFNIPLHIVQAATDDVVADRVCELLRERWRALVVVTDFFPLRQVRVWHERAAECLEDHGVPVFQVDAHNIVPVWTASVQRQVGARTLRPKIQKLYPKFRQDFDTVSHKLTPNKQTVVLPEFDRSAYETFLGMDSSVPQVKWAKPGTEAAMEQFHYFVRNGLKHFDALRNDPTRSNICSNLSPWINHGHVSFQRLAFKVQKLNQHANGTAAYIEEGVIRRELSDNYVYYTPDNYDGLEAAAGWAQETLETHSTDPREYVYTLRELERGQSHDDLWNAAQLQLVGEGQMHGFLRMYWAKKILEWTPSPLFALRAAQYLNDKYALDGKDPNGFVGVGWSIMGIHDQGWKEREIFGKIRYMNYAGCKRKFKVAEFVAKYPPAARNAAKAASSSSKGKRGATLEKSAASRKRAKVTK